MTFTLHTLLGKYLKNTPNETRALARKCENDELVDIMK